MRNIWAGLTDQELIDCLYIYVRDGRLSSDVEEEILRRLTGLRQALENVRTALNWRGIVLYIVSGDRTIAWHVGDAWPQNLTGRVVSFRADGHELTWLRDAIEAGTTWANGKYQEEVWGVKP